MASLVKLFLEYLNPRKIYLWMFLLVILLAVAAYYIYNKNKDKIRDAKRNKDVPNASGSGDVEIMFFTVDWCPHCKNAKTPWNDFKAGYHNKRIGDTLITCKEYNVTEKSEGEPGYDSYKVAENAQDKYKVDGFPTVKMRRGAQIIDFDAKITTYALEKFVENML